MPPLAVASLRTAMLALVLLMRFAIGMAGVVGAAIAIAAPLLLLVHINDILFVSQVNRIRLCCPRELCYIFASASLTQTLLTVGHS